MKIYSFSELPHNIQIDVIYGKLLDVQKMGLLHELAEYIVNYKINPFYEQTDSELYDINGNYIREE